MNFISLEMEVDKSQSPISKCTKTVAVNDDADRILATPVELVEHGGKKRKKKRILQDKTFFDDQGYIVTKKEYVFVSCSEDSDDNDVDPKDICHVMILPDVDENMVDRNEIHFWTRRSTLLLLELYKVYRPKVGMSNIKTIKKMFEIISAELSAKLCHKVSPAHCENRWKVLERGYRKFVDNAHKSGRGRKDFEFADIMSEILGGKKNIIPKSLISLAAEDHLAEPDTQERVMNNKSEDAPRDNDNQNSWARQGRPTRSASHILQALKHERKKFFKKKLELQEKKLKEKMKYMEKKLKLEEMKVLEERKRSETLLQSNILLREIIDILKET